MKIFVTGATGYIGKRFVEEAIQRGHSVTAASRQKPTTNNVKWIPYNFDNSDITDDSDYDVVIHLAAKTTSVNPTDLKLEKEAAVKLIQFAQQYQARFIFVSSQSARPDASSCYGRTKWHIEREFINSGGFIIRPGLVYGGEEKGLYGTLVNIVRKSPILPAFVRSPKLQPIHIDDLVEGLLIVSTNKNLLPGVIRMGSVTPVSFTSFLKSIANNRIKKCRCFIPFPTTFLLFLASIIKTNSGSFSLWATRLQSLFKIPIMKTGKDLEMLKLTLRDINTGMRPSKSYKRRLLIQEGYTILHYINSEKPKIGVTRRYVRAIEKLCYGRIITLPQWLLKFPFLLALIEESKKETSSSTDTLSWRLNAATMIAESTPLGAMRFINYSYSPKKLYCISVITLTLANEIFFRFLRFITRPLLIKG